VETPVAIRYNDADYAVIMATPVDLEDLALGFSLTEEVISRPADLRLVRVVEQPAGLVLDAQVPRKLLARQVLRQRRLASRSGCGLCGTERLEDAVRWPRRLSAAFELDPAVAARVLAALPGHQPMKSLNHTVHGAAWCHPDGDILQVREDVGRHNALDKLVGALARQGTDLSAGFVVLSSRCSFEMVQKAAAVGISALASVSAPTALALDLARHAGIRLYARYGEGVVSFDGSDTAAPAGKEPAMAGLR
jgi:FdhD protein